MVEFTVIIILAQREQFLAQRRIGQPHPRRQPLADPVGHFGGTGLGEGQAQDALGPDPAEQQAEHPRGQHLSLAGSGRSGHRGMRRRVDRAPLLAFKDGQRFQATRHTATPSKSVRASQDGEARILAAFENRREL